MTKTSPPPLSRSRRVTGIVASAVVLVVMIMTVLIVSPAGTPLRSEVRAAALPYFGQNWRVFAPDILKVNRTLEIRAQWRDGNGDLVKSGWVPITEIEYRAVTGNPAPSRIQKSSMNATGTYLTRYSALDDAQRERVRDTFIERSGDGFQAIPVEDLVDELGAGDSDVVRFLRMDYMLMRYSTLYATAGFGQEIERVQWRVVREKPNDFWHRFDEVQQFDTSVTTFGWRQSTVRVDADDVAAYRGVIERLHAQTFFQEAADAAQ
ncbi:DUF5819 family protein [Microbacterium sp.]|uniref:DUF5819 family protein n=1 Tax=Microbacterium sp. TaxID=51671 RepID=UPI0039E6ABD4